MPRNAKVEHCPKRGPFAFDRPRAKIRRRDRLGGRIMAPFTGRGSREPPFGSARCAAAPPDETTVVEYLVRSSLVDESAAGRFSVTDFSSRNRNFAVRTDGAQGLFLKQAAFALDRPAVAREARIYSYLEETAPPAARPPRLRFYDDALGALVVDLVPGGETLARHGRLSAARAAALGRALAGLHEVPPAAVDEQRPWALSADRPGPDVLRESSPANLKLLAILQVDSSLRAGLDRLRDLWRPSGFAHGDVRWDNVLVAPDAPDRVQLVDFEYAGPGDARADVGAVLGEYLWRWLDSIDLRAPVTTAAAARSPRSPLDELGPGVAAFWSSYMDERDHGRPSAAVAASFAAARLIEGAFERTADAWTVGDRPLFALQLAANVLADPQSAARDLFGLPVESP